MIFHFISTLTFKIIHSILKISYISLYFSILYFFTLSFKSYIHSYFNRLGLRCELIFVELFQQHFHFLYFSGPLLYKTQTLKNKFSEHNFSFNLIVSISVNIDLFDSIKVENNLKFLKNPQK